MTKNKYNYIVLELPKFCLENRKFVVKPWGREHTMEQLELFVPEPIKPIVKTFTLYC